MPNELKVGAGGDGRQVGEQDSWGPPQSSWKRMKPCSKAFQRGVEREERHGYQQTTVCQ